MGALEEHAIVPRCVLATYAVVSSKLTDSLDHVDVAVASLEVLATLVAVPAHLLALGATTVPSLSNRCAGGRVSARGGGVRRPGDRVLLCGRGVHCALCAVRCAFYDCA